MRNILVHAHIFKNAGTTFDFSLKNAFGEDFVDHRDDELFLQGRNTYLLDYLAGHPQVKALSSHSLHFRITGNEDLRLFPVYFLRHPLARVWSVYNFERQQTGVDTEGARRAKELDLNSYVDWYMKEGKPATIRNVHTIFLSGGGPSPDNMAEKFAAAKACLDSGKAFIALVERYDESMILLEDNLADVCPGLDLSYVRKNVTAANPDRSLNDSIDALLSSLSTDVAEKLQQKNAYDLQLYRQAGLLLDEKLAGMENPEKKLADFRARCGQLQAGLR